MLSAALSVCVILPLLGLGAGILITRGSPGSACNLVYFGCLVLCLAQVAVALAVLAAPPAHPAPTITLPIGLPWLSTHFRLDALSAVFLLIVAGVGALTSLFARDYHDDEPGRIVPIYPFFLAGMMLVLLADDAFAFLVSWEFMSVSSWLLVLSAHDDPAGRRAAYVYLVMAAVGTSALLLAFGILGGANGDYGFAAMRQHELSALAGAGVLALVLVGAGSKAGLAPLHVWLPLAHPAAPSPVSALMSGAMTKVAIYAIIRLLLDLAGHPAWWWGLVVLLIGAASAVLGVLFAVLERDLKTLLAYSTVENIGLIAIGIGFALAFEANGLRLFAGLALIAALFHALNHAVFKTLLFLGAGAVLQATHARDLDRLGGLIHRMPVTAATFLVGSLAIAALPPFNGFASEWLLFQTVLEGTSLPQWGLKFAVPVTGALLALAAALAATCFVRAFGIVFLGRARSAAAAQAHEVSPAMRGVLATAAGLCFLFGLFPAVALSLLSPAVEQLLDEPFGLHAASGLLWLTPAINSPNAYSPFALGVAFCALLGAVFTALRWRAPRHERRAPAWDCGYPDANPAAQYGGSSFAQPIRRVFNVGLYRATETLDMPQPGDARPGHFVVTVEDRIWTRLYDPPLAALRWATDRVNVLQFLTIRLNLTLMFGALVFLLLIAAFLR